ncbi:LuxR C-terminal-related transcriptional regulator [Humibacter antri]
MFEVARPRLVEPLEQLASGERTGIALWAAAGAGKSALIAQWARSLKERGDTVRWVRGPALLDALAELRGSRRRAFLFIDDAHRISSVRAKAALTSVLEDPVGDIRVVVAGRYQPVSGLALLQASGRLLELRTDDLAFDGDEVTELASRHGLELADDAAAALVKRTGGWATAIALAMPWLARSADVGAAVGEFSGDDGAVADFLISEVLAGFDDDTRRLLVSVAVNRYVPLDLAALLSGRADHAALLRTVATSNALITEDAHGFRFHPVLLAFLEAEARRLDRSRAARGHASAADWYAAHEQPADALHQAIESGDSAVLADMLSRVGLELALAGRSRLIASALARFTPEDEEPLVALVLRLLLDAPAFADRRRVHHVFAMADLAAAASPPAGGDAWVVALDAVRCFVEVRDGKSSAGASRLTDAVAIAERQASLGLDLLCVTAEGWLLARIGESQRALGMLRDVRVSAHRAGMDWLFLVASEFSISILSHLGRWDEAVVLEDRLVDAADRFTSAPRDRARRRVEVVAATRRYLRCVEGGPLGLGAVVASDPLGLDPELSATARVLELLPALDTVQNPRHALDELERLMRETAVYVPRTFALAAPRMVAARFALDGRARAKETAELAQSVLGTNSVEGAIVRYLLSPPLRNTEPAARQLGEAAQTGRAWHSASFVTAALHLARSAEDNGRSTEADAFTLQAVELAVRYRVERPFLAPATDGIGLITRRLGRFGYLEDEARRIVSFAPRACAHPDTEALVIESLTPKERDILAELPVHQSVAEIARKHSLSVNTIKTHLRNIYQKLGVSDRSEAVGTAQRLGLI